MDDDLIPLCLLSDLPEGQARGFLPASDVRRQVIVMRRDAGVVAYWDSCPHYAGGTPMAWRKDAYLNGDGTHFACHAHGALFDLDSGECVLGPCLGRRLTRVPVTVQGDQVLIPARLARA
ncbi:MAG: Rieske (2Fe-2S) protein [Paracoccus sp. (in: a-proteobacteria)]|uniref:Rieske (2Fe-2S) protein n=1 Tax=Paracoccus sp. TaxID=267 RepID=UPI0026E03B98|nr:Rieske (2Fe-2S) protein [Paracoccus sp. (in: a-proteobacteria)]MDO5620953.1 Rieske (2Fe-2S) protein [Paracoccus sp. (in: a-proteobacteria)]